MSHIEILLPFGLPPQNEGHALLSKLHAPGLMHLISRCRKSSRLPDFTPRAKALPHEAWLAYQLGLAENIIQTNSPPFATAAMPFYGLAQKTGFWFILHPAHIQLGHDQMIMLDKRQLELTAPQSRALFDAARTSFDEAGKTMIYGDETT